MASTVNGDDHAGTGAGDAPPALLGGVHPSDVVGPAYGRRQGDADSLGGDVHGGTGWQSMAVAVGDEAHDDPGRGRGRGRGRHQRVQLRFPGRPGGAASIVAHTARRGCCCCACDCDCWRLVCGGRTCRDECRRDCGCMYVCTPAHQRGPQSKLDGAWGRRWARRSCVVLMLLLCVAVVPLQMGMAMWRLAVAPYECPAGELAEVGMGPLSGHGVMGGVAGGGRCTNWGQLLRDALFLEEYSGNVLAQPSPFPRGKRKHPDAPSLSWTGGGERNLTVAFVGDGAFGPTFGSVLRIAKAEGAHAVVHAGDAGYVPGDWGARLWASRVDEELGAEFPVLLAVGNHDDHTWDSYASVMRDRMERVAQRQKKRTGARAYKEVATVVCQGCHGIQSSCVLEGPPRLDADSVVRGVRLQVVQSGVGLLGHDHASFVKRQLECASEAGAGGARSRRRRTGAAAAPPEEGGSGGGGSGASIDEDSIEWSVCSLHTWGPEDDRVGGDEVADVFSECAMGGAPVIGAHMHAYYRRRMFVQQRGAAAGEVPVGGDREGANSDLRLCRFDSPDDDLPRASRLDRRVRIGADSAAARDAVPVFDVEAGGVGFTAINGAGGMSLYDWEGMQWDEHYGVLMCVFFGQETVSNAATAVGGRGDAAGGAAAAAGDDSAALVAECYYITVDGEETDRFQIRRRHVAHGKSISALASRGPMPAGAGSEHCVSPSGGSDDGRVFPVHV